MKIKFPKKIAILSTIILILVITITSIYSKEEPTDYSDMTGLNFPNTFDEYISPYGEIDDNDMYNDLERKYKILLKQINNDDLSELKQKKYIENFNKPLRDMGFPIPFISFSSYLNTINNLDSTDRKDLLKLYKQYNDSEEDYQIYIDEISEILSKYNLNGMEVLDQLSNYNYKYAIFTISNNKVKLDNTYKTNVKNISKEREKFYLNIISNIFEITPPSIKNQIETIEFSTDGFDRSLAYVAQNDEYTKFRLSIDEKDAVDADDNFTREGLETLIHEFGHIITLNHTQVYIDEVESEEPDISKSYKPSSYLNKFYQLFWSDIYEDYKTTKNTKFYTKYKDQFVSDYAATNIDEDIAESFRVYVFDIEVEPDTIAAKKVNFFKNYPEMVKLKKHFKQYINQ